MNQADNQDDNKRISLSESANRFSHPEFISAELAQKLFDRGREERSSFATRMGRNFIWRIWVPVVVITFVMALLHMPVELFWTIIFSVAFVVVQVIATIKLSPIETAFKRGQFDRVASLLPDASRHIFRFYPLTYLQIYGLLLRVGNIMLLEGRMVELEAFTIYRWGMMSGKQTPGGVPQEFAVANSLGVAFLNQKKFVEAERIFADLASRKTNRSARLIILNNYALCLTQNKKPDEGSVVLRDPLILNECKRQSEMARHLLMVSAMNALEMGKFDEAEAFTTTTADLVKLLKEPIEASAACEAILAEIRAKQRRFEESKLHYANALDILEAADNPDYLILANHYRDYASMLSEAGENLSAEVAMTKSKQVFEFYVERESYAASLIANRLDHSSDLLHGIDLITIADRIKYIDVLKT